MPSPVLYGDGYENWTWTRAQVFDLVKRKKIQGHAVKNTKLYICFLVLYRRKY